MNIKAVYTVGHPGRHHTQWFSSHITTGIAPQICLGIFSALVYSVEVDYRLR